MRPGWIWVGAILLYGGFALWYTNLGGRLTEEEIRHYLERVEASRDAGPVGLANLREFLEADDGGEFFMVNLVRMHPDPVADPGSGGTLPAERVLEGYTRHFMPRLLARAGHVAFVGRAAARYVEHWGVEPDPGWTFAGVVRYRSRRDMMELATDPDFDPAHAYKIAAMASTLAFPTAPGWLFFGPRVWVGLVLALVAASSHLALRSRRAPSRVA